MICETHQSITEHMKFFHLTELDSFAEAGFSRIINMLECNKIFTYVITNYNRFEPSTLTMKSVSKTVSPPIKYGNEEYLKSQDLNCQPKNENVLHELKNNKPLKRAYKKRQKKHELKTIDNGSALNQSKALSRTEYSSLSANSETFPCLLCTAKIKDLAQSLRLHFKHSHHEVCLKVRFKCPLCSYSTQYRNTFSGHAQTSHPTKDPDSIKLLTVFQCALCMDHLIGMQNFKQHLVDEHNSSPTPIPQSLIEQKPARRKKSAIQDESANSQSSDIIPPVVGGDIFDGFF
ncbi:MAG: hypothetical protein MHPSP_001453 [Paramarteilia canceri]